ncbi:MAG: DUF86 domain-containing protein [Desulfofustis sp.]|nr:DUF86 domain-containing protein [Desulfofustis sp.]
MKKHPLSIDYVQDIIDAMDRAEEFIGNSGHDEFARDLKSVYAVVRCLEIIGEAVKKIQWEHRKRYKSIPWRSLAGMRDKLIHDYAGVSVDIVWQTTKEDIPNIKPLLLKMLQELRLEEIED